MPWRKHPSYEGRYGPIYKVAKGIKVRRDYRKMWILELSLKGERKNKSVGFGREGLVKAIKLAEAVAKRFDSIPARISIESANSRQAAEVSFGSYARQWLQENQIRWTEDTVERYDQLLRRYIEPQVVFSRPVREVQREEIKRILRQLTSERSPATVEAVHAVVSSIFEEAIDDGVVRDNPARGLLKKILPPKNQRDLKDPAPLTIEERDRLLAVAERICVRPMYLLLKVMAFMGLRLGEALAMRARHLELKRILYHVTEGFKCGVFKKPKGGKSRFVDVPDFLVAELEKHLSELKRQGLQQGRGGHVDLLFPDHEEEAGLFPFSQRKVQGELRRVCKAANLSVRNPHDLRHTYATILLMAGVSPAYVQRQLGHSSIAITVDVYGHWIPGEGRGGLEEALSGGGSSVPKLVRDMQIFAYTKTMIPGSSRDH